MPRSVETSKITACVGIFSAMAFRAPGVFVAGSLGEALAATRRYHAVLDRESSIFAKLDLPEPKNPRPKWRCLRAACSVSRDMPHRCGVVGPNRTVTTYSLISSRGSLVRLVNLDDLLDATMNVVREERLDRVRRH
jgi:hypothetical protein